MELCQIVFLMLLIPQISRIITLRHLICLKKTLKLKADLYKSQTHYTNKTLEEQDEFKKSVRYEHYTKTRKKSSLLKNIFIMGLITATVVLLEHRKK